MPGAPVGRTMALAVLFAVVITVAACAAGKQSPDGVIVIELRSAKASPQRIEREVTSPLEQVLSRLADVTSIRSSTYEGRCDFKVGFTGVSAAEMLVRVRGALATAKPGFGLPVEHVSLYARPRTFDEGMRDLTGGRGPGNLER